MARPKKFRRIQSRPAVTQFGPEGSGGGPHIVLSHEEYEAIRLIDYQGLDQSQAADIMGVSRQTVGRILKAGRFKLSQSIVEACRLKVEGGCYRVGAGHEPGRRSMMGTGRHKRGRRAGGPTDKDSRGCPKGRPNGTTNQK